MRIAKFFACLALVLFALNTRAAETENKLLVFAASSLTEAMNEIGDAYAATGKPKPVFSYAASSALARQIENGAPAAIFASADEEWMDYLATRKLIAADSRAAFVGNSLVLVAPADMPLKFDGGIKSGFPLAAALHGGKLALGDPSGVPAGRYAKAALENLKVWPSVEKSVVNGENVRTALAFVERGEAAAGIVYATDAALTKKVTVVGIFPADSHAPIVYPLAVVAAHDTPAARDFRAYLLGDAAKSVYRKYGFEVK